MSYRLRIIRRIILSLLFGLVFGFVISEASYLLLRETNRPPEVVTIVIPPGTAAAVSRGVSPPSIPDEMTFVVGDTLEVVNNDSTDHQLGPLWIPAGSTASMSLDDDQNFIFACSFQPSNSFGLDVREPVTFWTRVGGVVFAGMPMGAIVALYSIIAWPIKKENEEANGISPDVQ